MLLIVIDVIFVFYCFFCGLRASLPLLLVVLYVMVFIFVVCEQSVCGSRP